MTLMDISLGYPLALNGWEGCSGSGRVRVDGAFVGRGRKGQADGLAVGCEPLVLLGHSSAENTTRSEP